MPRKRKPAPPPTPLQDAYRDAEKALAEAHTREEACADAARNAYHAACAARDEYTRASAALAEASASDEAWADVLANREQRVVEAEDVEDAAEAALETAREAVTAAEAALETAREEWHDDEFEEREYDVRDDGGDTTITSCPYSLHDDLRDQWSSCYDDDDDNKTFWVTLYVTCDDGTDETVTVEVSPDEPECTAGEHDWRSPYSIVGGCKENPGVWGKGGGVMITEVCVSCGCGRHTDTWAQNPQDGTQGLTSVSYTPGEFSEALEGEQHED